MSPFASFAMTVSSSTTEAGREASTFITKAGEKSPSYFTVTLLPSAVTISAMFSGVQPSWVRMKAGVRFSFTTRAKEKTTSSARTGLPEWNLAPSRRVKVMVLAAGSIAHSLARPGASTVGSSASYCTSRS